MNKIVEAVKEGRKIETKDLFSVVNDFCLTRLAVKTYFCYLLCTGSG